MLTGTQKKLDKLTEGMATSSAASPALEWLWRHLEDVRHPWILDCGPVKPRTVNLLLKRGAKLYLADLITAAQNGAPKFWDRNKKQAVFRVADFVAQIPQIPASSLSAIFSWQLLDLLPRDALPSIVERFCHCLQPGGFIFCVLHEPYLATGSDLTWWLESLKGLGHGGPGRQPFPHPALTNRDVERLVPGRTVKTFLTRTGLREVLLMG